ncbi:hypothetical protein M9458_048670, partial [Cirrhinus mrigala]
MSQRAEVESWAWTDAVELKGPHSVAQSLDVGDLETTVVPWCWRMGRAGVSGEGGGARVLEKGGVRVLERTNGGGGARELCGTSR